MKGGDQVDVGAYARIFEGHPDGVAILNDLVSRFGGSLFVKGGEEGRRETDFRLGRRSVLDYVLSKIDQANNVPPPDDDDSQPAA
jgi:hypothetical protein